MKNLLPTSPEISTDLSNLHIRTDLINRSITVYLRDWNLWDVETSQVKISSSLIHFIEPDNTLAGIKVFSNDGGNQQ